MKVFAELGPGDIVAAHRSQMRGEGIVSMTGISYSGQVVEYCREQRIELLALTHNGRIDSVCDGLIRLENQPLEFRGGGLRYHLSMIVHAFRLAGRAWRFDADLALIDYGSAHCFALAIFKLL